MAEQVCTKLYGKRECICIEQRKSHAADLWLSGAVTGICKQRPRQMHRQGHVLSRLVAMPLTYGFAEPVRGIHREIRHNLPVVRTAL